MIRLGWRLSRRRRDGAFRFQFASGLPAFGSWFFSGSSSVSPVFAIVTADRGDESRWKSARDPSPCSEGRFLNSRAIPEHALTPGGAGRTSDGIPVDAPAQTGSLVAGRLNPVSPLSVGGFFSLLLHGPCSSSKACESVAGSGVAAIDSEGGASNSGVEFTLVAGAGRGVGARTGGNGDLSRRGGCESMLSRGKMPAPLRCVDGGRRRPPLTDRFAIS